MTEPYSRIIVGSDGSQTAERAVSSAAIIAAATGTPLTVATAWYRDMPDKPVLSELAEYPADSPGAMEAGWARQTVADGAGIARQAGVAEPATATPRGGPADGMLELSQEYPDALLVVGTVGLGSRAERFLGNVPHQITHHAAGDVLLVRSENHAADAYTSVALGTDGSKTAARAVERGLAFTLSIGATPVLLTAARDETNGQGVLKQATSSLTSPAPDDMGQRVVVGRKPAPTLIDVADDYDLLVIGNKGMSGPSRLLGSVANEITHRVPIDILLVNTTR